MKKIEVLIISLKGSNRQKIIKKNLDKINIKYKIINAINGAKSFKNKKKLSEIYDENFFYKKTGIKRLSAGEIGAAASHMKCYKYIVKNKNKNCIIMEDDCYSSELLKRWIKKKINIKNSIICFHAYGSGFLEKKKLINKLEKKISIHKAKTHIFSSLCYQINNSVCKKIISITRGKVTGYPDWPINFQKEKIKIFLTLPFICRPNDHGYSYLEKGRQKNSNINFLKKYNKIYDFLSFFYYLFFIPFLLGKYKNLSFYNEYFFLKKFFLLKNLITDKYLHLKKINSKSNCYASDIKIIN